MPVFTVHGPRAETARPSPDRIAFVRDGFAFFAFVFGGLWLAYHRLWLALLGYLVAVVALIAAMIAFGVPPGARFGVLFLVALLMGFEAASLRRWTLSRRKWKLLDVVVGDNRDEAERRFFQRWTQVRHEADATHRGEPPPPRRAAMTPAMPRDEIIGLFPQPGTPR